MKVGRWVDRFAPCVYRFDSGTDSDSDCGTRTRTRTRIRGKSDWEIRIRGKIGFGIKTKVGDWESRQKSDSSKIGLGFGSSRGGWESGRCSCQGGALRVLRAVACALCVLRFAFAFAFAVRVGGGRGGEGGGRREGAALPFAAAGRGGPRLASSRGGRVCGCYVAVAPYGSTCMYAY